MQYDDDKDDEWWWHLLVQVAGPYRKGVVSNMGRSQIYIQCSTLIRHCWHHHHHHHLGDNLWVKALNEGWMCSRLCLTVLGSPPFSFLANLLVLLFVFILLLLIDIIVIDIISWSSQRVSKIYKSDEKKNLLGGISFNSFVTTTPLGLYLRRYVVTF